MQKRQPLGPGTTARTNRILLLDADSDCEALLREVAGNLDCDVVVARTSREAFTHLHNRMEHLNLAVVDVDPGAHGLALLEAISACAERPPIVVISALEETYMRPIAATHGAAACLGKPITLEKLDGAIQAVARRCLTCNRAEDLGRCFRGIAEKLSPITSRCDCAADKKLTTA